MPNNNEISVTLDVNRINQRALTLGVIALIVAAVYPLLYPAIGYITSIFGFIKDPSLVNAIDLYAKLSGNDPFSGEHPFLASLPYWSKVELKYLLSFQIYVILTAITGMVFLLSIISRFLPTKLLRNIVRVITIGLAIIPFLAVTVFAIGMFFYSYYLAWQQWSGSFWGYIDFVIMVLIWLVVAAHVMHAILDIWLFTALFVPSALVAAGKNSLSARFFQFICELFL
ncbi:MAG: hypothetical protein GWN00_24150 [Aliifodinibius sp.]|nr:hypothetical protein [Fodinibius sp.]NIV13981.1 hypothetical protein [Fodinibius sp.]NIY27780.1 hypothetical protein [Fodinibius sp.]